jgi:hypothetical protein
VKKLSKAPFKNIEELKQFCREYEDVYMNEVNYLKENILAD